MLWFEKREGKEEHLLLMRVSYACLRLIKVLALSDVARK
jgi:hypothetical protein